MFAEEVPPDPLAPTWWEKHLDAVHGLEPITEVLTRSPCLGVSRFYDCGEFLHIGLKGSPCLIFASVAGQRLERFACQFSFLTLDEETGAIDRRIGLDLPGTQLKSES